MTIVMHLCRGNHESAWVAEGGYDPVAEVLFGDLAIDGFFLEYDSPRAGSFAPLRYLPKSKTAVLGLVTTKTPGSKARTSSSAGSTRRRKSCRSIGSRSSPQCGFASTIRGNALTVDDEKKKLALVVETAREVWGTA